MKAIGLAAAVVAVLCIGNPSVTAQDDEGSVELLGGVVNGVMVQDYENPMGCADWVLADGTILPAPTHMIVATGETNLLGLTTMTTAACYDAANMFENVDSGEWSMVNEGGDGLSGTYDANCIPDFSLDTGTPWECMGQWTITGGMGSYEEASGRMEGVATFMGTGFDEQGLMRTVPVETRFEGVLEQ